MVNEDLFDIVGYVMASEYRKMILRSIGKNIKIPSDIARDINLRTNHVSNVLTDLKKRKLVICLNEDAHKGRLYQNTDLALEILNYIGD